MAWGSTFELLTFISSPDPSSPDPSSLNTSSTQDEQGQEQEQGQRQGLAQGQEQEPMLTQAQGQGVAYGQARAQGQGRKRRWRLKHLPLPPLPRVPQGSTPRAMAALGGGVLLALDCPLQLHAPLELTPVSTQMSSPLHTTAWVQSEGEPAAVPALPHLQLIQEVPPGAARPSPPTCKLSLKPSPLIQEIHLQPSPLIQELSLHSQAAPPPQALVLNNPSQLPALLPATSPFIQVLDSPYLLPHSQGLLLPTAPTTAKQPPPTASQLLQLPQREVHVPDSLLLRNLQPPPAPPSILVLLHFSRTATTKTANTTAGTVTTAQATPPSVPAVASLFLPHPNLLCTGTVECATAQSQQQYTQQHTQHPHHHHQQHKQHAHQPQQQQPYKQLVAVGSTLGPAAVQLLLYREGTEGMSMVSHDFRTPAG